MGGCRVPKPILTIAAHSHGQTFLESTVLASISIQSNHQAFSVAQATIFDLLLNAAPEKTLSKDIVKYKDRSSRYSRFPQFDLDGHDRSRGINDLLCILRMTWRHSDSQTPCLRTPYTIQSISSMHCSSNRPRKIVGLKTEENRKMIYWILCNAPPNGITPKMWSNLWYFGGRVLSCRVSKTLPSIWIWCVVGFQAFSTLLVHKSAYVRYGSDDGAFSSRKSNRGTAPPLNLLFFLRFQFILFNFTQLFVLHSKTVDCIVQQQRQISHKCMPSRALSCSISILLLLSAAARGVEAISLTHTPICLYLHGERTSSSPSPPPQIH